MNAKTNLKVQSDESQSRLPIIKRIVRFDYKDIDSHVFYGDNPVISALWVGLSATFPLGEGEFIKSVKNYEAQVKDPKLKEEAANFAAQEAHHSLQHKKMNKQFDAMGFNTASIEAVMQEELDKRIEKWPNKKRLMRTVSAEHVTATFAHYALTHPYVLDKAPESFRNAMLWHAIEEIEHKSVAFDVYQTCEGDMSSLKRHYAFFTFLEFPFQMMLITRALLKQSKTKVTWGDRWGMLKHLFGKSGMISSVFSVYLMFLRRGFHPWQHDDSALIDEWKTKLSPYFQEVQVSRMQTEHYDALIIGAGISGLSAAYHFGTECPGKTYKVIERRKNIGGTWDLFNYPGIRSDSDMYTFGYSFKAWKDNSSIAKKDKILSYLEQTADEFDIRQHIEFGLHSQRCEWDSKTALWTVHTLTADGGEPRVFTCRFVFMCVGYYNYDHGYSPEFSGQEKFKGEILHPQFWPADADYADKNVVIIGSGATAVTMVPSMADKAEHVTMLQRSPTYMGSKPAVDPIANKLGRWFGDWAARWWFILTGMFLYWYCKAFPARAKKAIVSEIKGLLGDKFDAKHFTPDYNPWDQRVCLCPDADFFEAMKAGKASVVTDHIDRFTEEGILLKSGESLPADMIVTATGLDMLFLGGMDVVIDGKLADPKDVFIYKGFMCNDTPNMFACVGYTNASWTLKVDLTNRYACRLINYMDKHGHRFCVPRASNDIQEAPLLDLDSGYINRAAHRLPKQGSRAPWKLYQNYLYDKVSLKYSSLNDGAMEFQ